MDTHAKVIVDFSLSVQETDSGPLEDFCIDRVICDNIDEW